MIYSIKVYKGQMANDLLRQLRIVQSFKKAGFIINTMHPRFTTAMSVPGLWNEPREYYLTLSYFDDKIFALEAFPDWIGTDFYPNLKREKAEVGYPKEGDEGREVRFLRYAISSPLDTETFDY